MSVFCLGAGQIDSHWDLYGHHLQRLEDETGLAYAGQIRKDLRATIKQLWGIQHDGVIAAVAVTQIVEMPRGSVCEIYCAAGTASRKEMREVVSEITRWAKAMECVQVRVLGRKGWKRVLSDFADCGVILEKDL